MMRPFRILAAFMILAGAGLLVYGVVAGEMQVALLLIVPVIYGSSALGFLAIGLIIAGILVSMADFALSASAEGAEEALVDDDRARSKKAEFGGVILIGPIPIIFGADRRMTFLAIMVAVAILVIMILSLFYSGG